MNDEYIKQLSEMLSGLEPGFLPFPLFEQIARIMTLPVIEFVPLRINNDKVEVLLIPRPDDDAYWPGMLHTPGTVIRATDINEQEDNKKTFKRLIHDELKDTEMSPPHYVESILNSSKRGTTQAQIYWVEVLGEPKVGTFYSLHNLPEGFIKLQENFINMAAKNFLIVKSK
jgi:hypothetical protein